MASETPREFLLRERLRTRPAKTTSTYKGPQKRYREWATQTLVMIEQTDLDRGKDEKLGLPSMLNHVNAIVDLYNSQVSVLAPGVAQPEHPRNRSVKQFLAIYRRDQDNRRKDERVDRAIGTVLDGYTMDQHRRLCQYLLEQNTIEGFRTRADHMIADGLTPAKAVILVSRQGKLNKCGRIEYMSVLRHRHPELCLVSALFLYLFLRFQHEGFLRRDDWYDRKLFAGRNPLQPLSYHAHLNMVNKAFAAVGITSKKKTHAPRGSAVRKAENAECEENQLRRAGRWNADAMSQAYLTNLPLQLVQDLIRKVAQAVQYKQQMRDALIVDISATGFTELMLWGRTVLLQDVPLLRFPTESPIFLSAIQFTRV
ncbi:TPA: hypothetical protein N0F65_008758 [Lagenidium giganteum]|uniref:Ndc10 domain-containing protein n=1 Tax=Lagenidium giganteum TaxID=4803 RepID=A0AAV2Z396_9STRA|nr:TPA: hypothetical protein N0F65_008758 [Lagenidium giganteum]